MIKAWKLKINKPSTKWLSRNLRGRARQEFNLRKPRFELKIFIQTNKARLKPIFLKIMKILRNLNKLVS